MYKALLLLTFTFHCFFATAQSKKELIKKGVAMYEAGQYLAALQQFEQVLTEDPNHATALYEASMAHLQLGHYDKALSIANEMLKRNSTITARAYVVKSTALEKMGKPIEAISVAQEGLKRYAMDANLNFNVSLTYYNTENYDSACIYAMRSIALTPAHTSSHLLLGQTLVKQGHWMPGMMALYRALLLEPTGDRAASALKLLDHVINNCVDSGRADMSLIAEMKDKSKQPTRPVSDYVMLFMTMQKQRAVDSGLNHQQTFVELTDVFFDAAGQLINFDNGFLDDYKSVLCGISKNDHTEAFCYYISRERNDPAVDAWISENKKKIIAFKNWLSSRTDIVPKQ